MKTLYVSVALVNSWHSATSASNDQSAVIDFSTAWQTCATNSTKRQWLICPYNKWGRICPFHDDAELLYLAVGCMRCPNKELDATYGSDCKSAVHNIRQAIIDVNITGLASHSDEQLFFDTSSYSDQDFLDLCIQTCEAGGVGNACSKNQPCTQGTSFCDYSSTDTGTCQQCPSDANQCYHEGFLSNEVGKKECAECALFCQSLAMSNVNISADDDNKNIQSSHMGSIISNTTELLGTGNLIDCSDLILDEVNTCPRAAGRVCLVEDYTMNTLFWNLSNKAERSGCTAVIIFGDYSTFPSHKPCALSHSFDHLGIPFVCISFNDGKLLKKEALKSVASASVSTSYFGSICYDPSDSFRYCSHDVPCLDGEFCDFQRKISQTGNGVYVDGHCTPCDQDPLYCYFDPG